MSKSLKWFLVLEEDGVTIHNKNGSLLKPDSTVPFGGIFEVSLAPQKARGKYSEEAVVQVSCFL